METPPLRVYGSKISYFTGKLEGYLRYKEIPYAFVPMTARLMRGTIPERTGVAQMPAVELADGRWLTDTTPTIAWLEAEHPEPEVIPADPLQAFVSRLLEDYADEWLWRPALHYRWSHPGDAHLLSRMIVDELLGEVPLPAPLKRWSIRRRQKRHFVAGDGVTPSTRPHVESIYLRTLEGLEAILAVRPFLLGAAPTLADFGFFASMWRHFGIDPTPAALMRERAPGVAAWLTRLWRARGSTTPQTLADGIPADWSPLLEDVGGAYLPSLAANARAWKRRERRHDLALPGVHYRGLRTSRYRVHCLERLRAHYEALPGPARRDARTLLEKHGAWEPLWQVADPDSGVDPEGRAPFAPGCAQLGL